MPIPETLSENELSFAENDLFTYPFRHVGWPYLGSAEPKSPLLVGAYRQKVGAFHWWVV